MASRFSAPVLPPPPAAGVRDSGRENNPSFPYSSSVVRGPETEVRKRRKGKEWEGGRGKEREEKKRKERKRKGGEGRKGKERK